MERGKRGPYIPAQPGRGAACCACVLITLPFPAATAAAAKGLSRAADEITNEKELRSTLTRDRE